MMDSAPGLGIVVTVIAVGLLLMSVAIFGVSQMTGQVIGGDRDDHGCLISAGYVHDEDIGACVRSWELDGDLRTAAMAAANEVGFSDGLTVVSVEPLRCRGCFDVELERYGTRYHVQIRDWVVI